MGTGLISIHRQAIKYLQYRSPIGVKGAAMLVKCSHWQRTPFILFNSVTAVSIGTVNQCHHASGRGWGNFDGIGTNQFHHSPRYRLKLAMGFIHPFSRCI